MVRAGTRPQPTLGEDGARCALVQRVPLVVAGAPLFDPFDEFATRTIDRTFDVVDTCVEAAQAPIEALGRRATDVIAELIGVTAADLRPRAVVVRRAGRLAVHVTHGETMTRQQRSQAAVRIAMAVRELDPFAAGIDVAFDGTSDHAAAGAGESTQ